jgi:hypothetical protein
VILGEGTEVLEDAGDAVELLREAERRAWGGGVDLIPRARPASSNKNVIRSAARAGIG